MATNVFRGLHQLYPNGNWIINITSGEGKMIVSVLPVSDKLNDKAVKLIPPMNLSGTPQELDESFFSAIQKPVEKTVALFTNLEGYEAAVEKAKAQSKMESDKKDKAKKEAGDKNTKYEAQMKKVTELETQNKIGEAIGQLPKAEDFPDRAEEIKKKLEELRGKHGTLSLFDENQ